MTQSSGVNGVNGVLDDYEQRVADIARRAEQVREQLAAVRPSATSPDGAVTVTVTSAGVLAGLSFAPNARDLELHQLAALVLRTSQQAHRAAALQTQAALTPLVGADSAAQGFLREALPDDDELDEQPVAPVAPADTGDTADTADAADRSVRGAAPPPSGDTVEDEGFTGRGSR